MIEEQHPARGAASPLELIADWLVARYPFDNLAKQLGMTPQAAEEWLGGLLPDPAVVTLPDAEEPYSEPSWDEREILKATIAERADNAARVVDWSGDIAPAGDSGITLPTISATIGPRVDGRHLSLPQWRSAAQKSAWAAYRTAGLQASQMAAARGKGEDAENRAAAHAMRAQRQYLRGRPTPGWTAAQTARLDKAAWRRAEIVRLHDQGMQQTQIALILGISDVTCWRALKAQRG